MTLASAKLKASVQFPSLRGMYQREGTCKGFDTIKDAIVGDAPLMLPNADDDPSQLLVHDAIRTMTAWRCNRFWRMS